jgi:Ethanolamine utilization protein EutJ (predicted chaperonin)
LVTFALEDDGDGGTVLTMVESGYDSILLERIETAKRNNTKGWDEQAINIANYLREHP